MAEPIPYMGPEPGRRWEKIVRLVLVIFAALVGVSVMMSKEICTNYGWVCAVCQSMRYETEWAGGMRTGRSIHSSSLDAWMKQNLGGHVHNWKSIQGTGRNIFGQPISSSHGRAPPIYAFPPQFLSIYLRSASPDEVKLFVQTMQSGTDDSQRRAVEAATDDAIDLMHPPPTRVLSPATK